MKPDVLPHLRSLLLGDGLLASHAEIQVVDDAEAFSLSEELLDEAEALLNTPSVPRDGYYAFVCEKCAPSFEYYGYFLTAEDLKERSKKIYDRS